jgi:ribosomal protein S18 acetylase RimI-like enzyme
MSDSSYTRGGGELRLSNLGQLELLRGMVGRAVPLRTTVRGFSMAPFIRDEDVLTITPLNGRAPRVGEVVAFTLPYTGRLAIHRVIAAVDEARIIRGDNRPEPDGLVPCAAILGRVTRIERRGREVRLGLGPEGRLIAWLQRAHMLGNLMRAVAWAHYAAWPQFAALPGAWWYRARTSEAGHVWARIFGPRAVIGEATREDMHAVQERFTPGRSQDEAQPAPNLTNYVARRRGEIAGFVQLVRHPESHFPWVGYWLFSLHVWEPYRRLGIGRQLTDRVIDQASAEGARELWLVVFEDNLRAIRLYRRLGFEQVTLAALDPQLVEEREKTGRRRVVMRRELSTPSCRA